MFNPEKRKELAEKLQEATKNYNDYMHENGYEWVSYNSSATALYEKIEDIWPRPSNNWSTNVWIDI